MPRESAASFSVILPIRRKELRIRSVLVGERGKPIMRDKVEDVFEVFWGPPTVGMG